MISDDYPKQLCPVLPTSTGNLITKNGKSVSGRRKESQTGDRTQVRPTPFRPRHFETSYTSNDPELDFISLIINLWVSHNWDFGG